MTHARLRNQMTIFLKMLIVLSTVLSILILLVLFYFESQTAETQGQAESSTLWTIASFVLRFMLGTFLTVVCLGRLIFWRLPVKWRYIIHTGYLMWTRPVARKVESLFNRLRRSIGIEVGREWHDLTEEEKQFSNAVAQVELINFCLSLPPESAKMAMVAAVGVLRAQEAKIQRFNEGLDRLEAQDVDVSAHRLVTESEALGNPFSPNGPLNREYLMQHNVSMANYAPYMERLEQEQPWYPSLARARRERQQGKQEKKSQQPKKVKTTSPEVYHTLSVEQRHSEHSLSGFSSNSTRLSDIVDSFRSAGSKEPSSVRPSAAPQTTTSSS